MVSLLERLLEKIPNITFKSLLQNYQYKIFYNQIARLNYLFYSINKTKPESSENKVSQQAFMFNIDD